MTRIVMIDHSKLSTWEAGNPDIWGFVDVVTGEKVPIKLTPKTQFDNNINSRVPEAIYALSVGPWHRQLQGYPFERARKPSKKDMQRFRDANPEFFI